MTLHFPLSNAEMSSRTSVVRTETANLIAVFSSMIIIVCAINSIGFLSIGYAVADPGGARGLVRAPLFCQVSIQ